MNISFRINTEDKKLFKTYAKLNNMTLSELIRTSVLEKIEDEYDIAIANLECEEYEKTKEGTPIQELWDELGL